MTIIQSIANLYTQFSVFTKDNQIVAGAVSLWGLSVLTYLVRNVPMRIYAFIKSQVTTSLTFNNAGWSGNELHFNSFGLWFQKNKGFVFSRRMSITVGDDITDLVVGPGYGAHFFFFKRRLFIFEKVKLPSQASHAEKEEIIITMLGRDQRKILELIEAFKYRRPSNILNIYTYGKEGWVRTASIKKKDLSTVIVKKELKQKIVSLIENFISGQDWYRDRGIPYKEAFIFHGRPGTGKTSLTRSLASHFNRNIYQLDIAQMSGHSFQQAMQSLPAGAFCLIEDFDSASALKKRKNVDDSSNSKDAPAKSEPTPAVLNISKLFDNEDNINLSSILNTLDGVVSLDDVVLFMTTNALCDIDSAFLRKGRVDHIFEIPYFEDTEIREYIKLMYPNSVLEDGIEFESIAGCDIQAIFKDHKNDFDSFLEKIPRKQNETNVRKLHG